jgi:hypothetical protein
MNLIITAVVLALIVGICEVVFKFRLPDPWRMVVILGIVVLFVVGLLLLLAPGLFSGLGRY